MGAQIVAFQSQNRTFVPSLIPRQKPNEPFHLSLSVQLTQMQRIKMHRFQIKRHSQVILLHFLVCFLQHGSAFNAQTCFSCEFERNMIEYVSFLVRACAHAFELTHTRTHARTQTHIHQSDGKLNHECSYFFNLLEPVTGWFTVINSWLQTTQVYTM